MSALTIALIKRRGAVTPGLVADRSPDIAIARQGFRRMRLLLAALANPHLACPVIHIAGSKGKGTTTHIAAALLTAHGLKTGRYVSPHLLNWNERIAIDDVPIQEPDFTRTLTDIDQVMVALESGQPEIGMFNSFELLTAAAFVCFRAAHCQVAVIEVGLGGRFDSTNHVQPIATIITRVEEEHVDILGPTLRDVAWNKAGVIKPDVPVILTSQRPEVDEVIESEAQSVGASILRERLEWSVAAGDGDLRYRFPPSLGLVVASALPGNHNRSNIGAALTAVNLALDQPLRAEIVSTVLTTIRVPGRFERRVDLSTGRHLVLDVAHTSESISAFIKTATELYEYTRFPFIISLLSDKPASDILAVITPNASQVIFPYVDGPRTRAPSDLHTIASDLDMVASIAPTVRAAIDAISPDTEPILITGSFSIVAESLRLLQRSGLTGE